MYFLPKILENIIQKYEYNYFFYISTHFNPNIYSSLFTVPQIIILGPPAAGKHSISKMVCNKLRTIHLTPENLIQESDLKLRDEAESFVQANKVT